MIESTDKYIESLHKRMQKKNFNLNEELDYVFNKYDDQKDIIDRMLALDATVNMQIDVDSSQSYKEKIKKDSRLIYRRLKKIDKTLGESLLQHQDK